MLEIPTYTPVALHSSVDSSLCCSDSDDETRSMRCCASNNASSDIEISKQDASKYSSSTRNAPNSGAALPSCESLASQRSIGVREILSHEFDDPGKCAATAKTHNLG